MGMHLGLNNLVLNNLVLSKDTLKLIERLTSEERVKVEKVVKRHVLACQRNGFQPENIDRVFAEALELVAIEEKFPDPKPVAADIPNWEPFRRYEQYVSPTVP